MLERFFSRNKKQVEIPKKIPHKISSPTKQRKKILIKRRYLLDNKGDRAMLLEELPFAGPEIKPVVPKEKFLNEQKFKEGRDEKPGTWEKIIDENKLLQQIIGYQKEKNLELESIIEEIGDGKKIVQSKQNPVQQAIKDSYEGSEGEAMEINFYMVSTNEELEKKLKVRREEGSVILNVNGVHIVINNKNKNHFPVVGWA